MNPSIRIMLAATALVAAPPLLAHGVAAARSPSATPGRAKPRRGKSRRRHRP